MVNCNKITIKIILLITLLLIQGCNDNQSILTPTVVTPEISITPVSTPEFRQLLLETKLRPDRKFANLNEVETYFDKHGLLNKEQFDNELNKLFESDDGANYVVEPGNYPITIVFYNEISKINQEFWNDARAEVETDGGYILQYGNIIISHQLKEFELSLLLADLADSSKSTGAPSTN
ncbi:MAG: hypothetical protein CL758_00670 [Chloroflexi bacterium]|nr:hypothetical protein [Chloroflexota bacterium]|tara:strand:- start:26644 stop:27177 length:534 start_codon:yes stop_codon:yes gene_type:complete